PRGLFSDNAQGSRGADIGYLTPCDGSSVHDNYLVADKAVNFDCTNTTFENNTLYGAADATTVANYTNNTYYGTTRPAGVRVFVRPNLYEPGRAHVAIYNWDLLAQVPVDLSSVGLNVGDAFEVRDAQNFYGTPVVTGTYNGALVNFPMRNTIVT